MGMTRDRKMMINIGRDPWDEREGREARRSGRGIGRIEKDGRDRNE